MKAKRAAVLAVAASIAGAAAGRPLALADPPNLAGRWTLNRAMSRVPEEIGFGMDLVAGAGSETSGRGDLAGANAAAMALYRESADDATRRDHLVNEVRRPPEDLAITQTDEAVIIAADAGRPRTFRIDGHDTVQMLGRVAVSTTARWNGARFEVRYKVQENREVRYEYSRTADPARLTVDVRFVERGGHDTATLVYEPASTTAPAPVAPMAAAPPPAAGAPPAGLAGAAAPPTLRGLGQFPPAGGQAQPPAGRPAVPTLAPPPRLEPAPGPVGPDAGLAGLTRIGMVVEELRPQAAACGLAQAPLEAIVSKAFTDAGIKVMKDADEDTYVYVDIGTTNVNAGLCVSRYDVYLFSNTMATLSHQSSPVLVQVQLMHEGGLAGGAPVPHGESVRKSVKTAVDSFVSRIRVAGARQDPSKKRP